MVVVVGWGVGGGGGREYMYGSWPINKDIQLTHMQAEYIFIYYENVPCECDALQSKKQKNMNKLKRARGKQQFTLAVY